MAKTNKAKVMKRAARTRTIVSNPAVMMTAQEINAGLREYEKATGTANQNVLHIYRAAAELIRAETGGTWPDKSLTKAMVGASQALTDMFCMVQNRGGHLQTMKAVLVDYDAIWEEGERNGWARSIDSIARAVRRANAPKKQEKAKSEAEPTAETEAEEPTAEAGGDEAFAEKSLDHFAQEVLKILRSANRQGFSPKMVMDRLKEIHAETARADAKRDMAA